MKHLLGNCIFIVILGLGSNVLAFQEAIGVVTRLNYDKGRQVCTIEIDRNHPITNRTSQCHQKIFSWKCLSDDYRYVLAEQSQKNNQVIKIRYSEYECDDNTRNMLLLTVW
jgi:hypothetical protein